MSFATWQPPYAEVGLITIPISDKSPAVRNWLKFTLSASSKMVVAPRFADMSIGVLVGQRNRLTILDVDSADELLLERMLRQHGDTPVIVRTASGKFHCWYRNNKERRGIRIYGAEPPVDLPGANGFAVAPPSITDRGTYEFIRGGLGDVANLPTIKGLNDMRSAPPRARHEEAGASRGHRNDLLFRACLRHASEAGSFENLTKSAHQINAEFDPPLARIVHVAAEAGMCLHASAVWQIHRFGSDVVDRCAAGIDLAQRVGGLRQKKAPFSSANS